MISDTKYKVWLLIHYEIKSEIDSFLFNNQQSKAEPRDTSIQSRKRLRSTLPIEHSSNMLSSTFPEGKLLTDQDMKSTKTNNITTQHTQLWWE